jgi:hypothetical protein
MHRHQRVALFLDPELALLMTTGRTVAVATTPSDPMLAATAVALVVHTTERAGAAAGDPRDHPLHMDWQLIFKPRQAPLALEFCESSRVVLNLSDLDIEVSLSAGRSCLAVHSEQLLPDRMLQRNPNNSRRAVAYLNHELHRSTRARQLGHDKG